MPQGVGITRWLMAVMSLGIMVAGILVGNLIAVLVSAMVINSTRGDQTGFNQPSAFDKEGSIESN
jgi:hypothetical protein